MNILVSIQSGKVEYIRTGNSRNGKRTAVLFDEVAAACGGLVAIEGLVDQQSVVRRGEGDPKSDRRLTEEQGHEAAAICVNCVAATGDGNGRIHGAGRVHVFDAAGDVALAVRGKASDA